jgi:serine/threonine protein phosphatase 1
LGKGGIHFRDARGPDGMALYAVGDVHGRLDLLKSMFAAIAADRDSRKPRDWRIILLGDYVDRGPDSRGVIDFIIKAQEQGDGRIVPLAGNHDVGFLEFLAEGDPGGIFANYGGAETALSYGTKLDFGSATMFRASQRALAAATPKGHVAFLRTLLFSVEVGDFFFCHAGIRPGVALDKQDPLDLTWIREEFHQHEKLHPKVIVHGHTPTPEPEVLPNRVNLDTGAFATGRLTALVIDGQEKQLLVVEQAV